MSCFFCESNYHVSHNCDIYDSHKLRRNILYSKNCCQNCFGLLDARQNCKNCKNSRKCYICFFQAHSTIYCPDRPKALILPKIDEYLLLRFGQLLNVEEKWFLAFSYPSIFELIGLKPLTIKFSEIDYFPNYECYVNYDLIIAEKFNVENGFYRSTYGPSILNTKRPIFYITYLDINLSSMIPSQEMFMLLSIKTKHLKCTYYSNTKFHPELTFQEILKKAPNLEEIDIHKTNIKVEDSWLDDIVCFNKSDSLRNLHFTIFDASFDTDSLITLLKKTVVNIHVVIASSILDELRNHFESVKIKLSKHLISQDKWQKNTRIVFEFYLKKFAKRHFLFYTFIKL